MIKRQAQVTLRQESIDRMIKGKAVTIRLKSDAIVAGQPEVMDIELQLRFDPLAGIGNSGSLEEMVAAALGKRRH